MPKKVIGSYVSKEEAVKAVSIYELKGHLAKNIIMLTNTTSDQVEDLKNRTDVEVKNISSNSRQITLKDKLIQPFTFYTDFNLDTPEKLINYGLSEEDAKKCIVDVKAGKILVIADDELRMGHE